MLKITVAGHARSGKSTVVEVISAALAEKGFAVTAAVGSVIGTPMQDDLQRRLDALRGTEVLISVVQTQRTTWARVESSRLPDVADSDSDNEVAILPEHAPAGAS